MPWLDPARRNESAEDQALREDLRALLGVPEPPAPVQTPELTALAEDLRREALRRSHTPALIQRLQPRRLLLAAGLPLALTVLGAGAYGVQQKRRADALAAAMAQKDAEVQRLSRSHQQALERERALQEQQTQMATAREPRKTGPRELVLPAQRTPTQPNLETQQVNQKR